VIGCGYFAQNHLNGWGEVEGAEIVVLCDRDSEALHQTARFFGIERTYTDAEAMLAETDLDFVDVVTRVGSHRELVELAAAQKTHVICQKPFAPSVEDARNMVVACIHSGVTLMVHENFRWQTPIRALKGVLTSGAIGTPFFGQISFRSAFDVYSNQPYLATDDRFIVSDLGIHLLDLARFLMGDVEQMYTRTQRVNTKIKGEDVATIILDIEDGKTCVVDASYASRLEHEIFPQTLIRIEGSEGSVHLERDFRLTTVSSSGVTVEEVPPEIYSWSSPPGQAIQDGVVGIQRHWVDCLENGLEPETSGRDNLKTLELVFGAYNSAEHRSVYRTEQSLGCWSSRTPD